MGLTADSTGLGAAGIRREKERGADRVIALAGNPNVGKSTVFNALTGMNQHTGNWPGKTVATAQGIYRRMGLAYLIVDLPGTYSLLAHSAEEEVARDFLCFGGTDAVIVVCDATCLERNLNLVLQTLEITPHVVVCVNLCDEAEKKGIRLHLEALETALGVPVVGTSARSERGLDELMNAVERVCGGASPPSPAPVRYADEVEDAAAMLEEAVKPYADGKVNARWLSLRLLEMDGTEPLRETLRDRLGEDVFSCPALKEAREKLEGAGLGREMLRDRLVSCIVLQAEALCRDAVSCPAKSQEWQRRLDRFLTSRITGIPVMLALLCGVLWLTITGANFPSSLLSQGLFWIQDRLTDLFHFLGAPEWLHGLLVLGAYRVLAWVVAVMLPPMAIFFPLFTLLEDFGYLPRVAFNLDHCFKKAHACGKQALTLCMGFGCNAAGVVGCRIIDSPRERLIAILTNSFVPCNGRFPPP